LLNQEKGGLLVALRVDAVRKLLITGTMAYEVIEPIGRRAMSEKTPDDVLRHELKAEFDRMEAALVLSAPGVAEAMRVYEQCIAAMTPAEKYLAALYADPPVTTSNTSG
jgi:hypothetical protein